MKALLAILLLLPTLAFGQGYLVNQTPLGTDSLWLNYIGSSLDLVIHNDGSNGTLINQIPAAISLLGVVNTDTLWMASGAGNLSYITSGPSYDVPTGTVAINSTFIVGSDGSLNGGSTLTGRDSWSGTATNDTVTISGAATTDNYFITIKATAVPGATDISFAVEPTSTGFIIRRGAAGTSGLEYMWMRIR